MTLGEELARRNEPVKRSRIKVRAKSWKKELDDLCRRATFARDSYRCARCGKTDRLQWCHVRSRRYLSTRWRFENVLTLCSGCHLWQHHNPLEASEWFKATYPVRYTSLSYIDAVPQKLDRAALKLYLQQEAARLEAACSSS